MDDHVLDFLKRVQLLRWIDRFSNTPHIQPYSVAQHSFYVALYGLIFAKIENEREWEENDGNADIYDVNFVVQKALVHDLEESITGDILFPLHNDYPEFKEKLDFIRTKSVRDFVFKELPPSTRMQLKESWATAKDDTPEGILIACMDKVEIIAYALTEMELGNEAIREIYNNAVNIIRKEFKIKSVLEVLDRIEATFPHL